MLDARYSTRRLTVPPAASIDRCHASLRETSATICNSVVTASTQAATPETAAANSSRRPASRIKIAAAVASEPRP
jgi:hypothetical protein